MHIQKALTAQSVIDITKRRTAPNYAPLDLVLTEGEGAYVTDIEGNRYLDFLAGYSTLLFGHCPPRITEAAHAQLDRLTLTSRSFYNDRLASCLEEVSRLTGKEGRVPLGGGISRHQCKGQ